MSTLTTINTVESGEWAGKIKHHRDPKGRCLEKRKEKSLFWWAVIMFSWRQRNTEPTGKQLNWTASLKVRDTTITVCTLNLVVPVQLFYILCVSASYSFNFQVLLCTSSYVDSHCIDCEAFLIWPWLWKGKEGCPWAACEYEERRFTYFLNILFTLFISSPVVLPPLPRLTAAHASNRLHKEYLSISQLQMSTQCVRFFFITWLSEVQERAGVRILSVLLWNGTSMFAHNKLHPHSENKHKRYCDHLFFFFSMQY